MSQNRALPSAPATASSRTKSARLDGRGTGTLASDGTCAATVPTPADSRRTAITNPWTIRICSPSLVHFSAPSGRQTTTHRATKRAGGEWRARPRRGRPACHDLVGDDKIFGASSPVLGLGDPRLAVVAEALDGEGPPPGETSTGPRQEPLRHHPSRAPATRGPHANARGR